MVYRLMMTALLAAGTAVLISLIPYDFEVVFRKDWQSYRVSVRFRLLWGRAGLNWGPYTFEWSPDQAEDDEGLLYTLIDNLRILKKLPFSLDQKLELLDAVGLIIENTRVRELRWYTEIGLKDPAATAVLTGMLWALKGWFCAGIISAMGRVRAVKAGERPVSWGVHPSFNRPGYRIDLLCRLSGNIRGVAGPLVRFLSGVFYQQLAKTLKALAKKRLLFWLTDISQPE
ncbi:MAG: DUF2953 domain-containing protein [Firmicutes bacterium]|nr:DUF2953 domain-containing protein [Bacillota bacterium]